MGSIAAAPLAVVRLAILECDTPRPIARSRYGSYGGMFERILRTDEQSLLLSDEHAGTIQVSKWQIDCDEAEYPDLDAIDALLMTGSKYSAYQNIPWISRLITYTRQALATERVKIIGTCFGHQILGMALHAHVGPNPRGWRLAVLPVELSSAGRALFKTDRLSLQFSHQDVVFDCPAGIEILGSTKACANQGMYAPGRLLSLQGHPEFDEQTIREILDIKLASGGLNQQVFQECVGRAGLPQDGLLIGMVFREFLLK